MKEWFSKSIQIGLKIAFFSFLFNIFDDNQLSEFNQINFIKFLIIKKIFEIIYNRTRSIKIIVILFKLDSQDFLNYP